MCELVHRQQRRLASMLALEAMKRHRFQKGREGMKQIFARFRIAGNPARRLGGLAAVLLLVVLVGSLVVGLVLVRASGEGPLKTAAALPGLYVGSLDGSIYKLNAQTGALRWREQVGWQITGMQAVNGVIYASALNGEGRTPAALSASTGKTIWSGRLASKRASAPALANGVVCIIGDGLYAFAATSGRLLWQDNSFRATEVAAFGDLAFSAETDENGTGTLDAFDARTGKVHWSVPAPSPGWWFSGLVAAHDVLYAMLFASQQGGYEYAFNARDGSTIWQSSLLHLNGAYNPPGPPLVVGGGLYLPTTDGSLIALDTRTGMQLWTYAPAKGEAATNFGGFSPLWVTGEVVYIGEIGHIKALNASDGSFMQQIDVAHYQGSAFLVTGNSVYVNSADGVVHALKLTDGVQVWQYTYFRPNQETGFDAAAMVMAA
jgi:outer membrane protein assembly factor BamB